MPYMDSILRDLANGNPDVELFGRHVHWGYWPDPGDAEVSDAEYAAGAERMTHLIADAAGVHNGMRVLDCGCGIGGTVASLNERYDGVDLVGLNIDSRQLDVARATVVARPQNQVAFVQGDACALPFPDASFDAVLAVECIFHFPGRLRFMREARRVLRPGGRLGISDYVPPVAALPLLAPLNWSLPFLGARNRVPPTMPTYRLLARLAGMRVSHHADITRNTLPSYSALIRYFTTISDRAADEGRRVAKLSRRGLLRYKILAFAS